MIMDKPLAKRHGYALADGHEVWTEKHDEEWCVVVNGRIVDRFTSKFGAMDLVRGLVKALRLDEFAHPAMRRTR